MYSTVRYIHTNKALRLAELASPLLYTHDGGVVAHSECRRSSHSIRISIAKLFGGEDAKTFGGVGEKQKEQPTDAKVTQGLLK